VSQCLRFFISGRVQGVSFRAATRKEARRLGLHGYARNLDDGRVEVLAAGSEEALRELERWLHRGPPLARVEQVTVEPAIEEPRPGFHIG